jgi:hypothetical protein
VLRHAFSRCDYSQYSHTWSTRISDVPVLDGNDPKIPVTNSSLLIETFFVYA